MSCLWPFGKSNRPAVPGHEGPVYDYTQIGDKFYPMVDVAIFRQNFQLFKIRALVDSGASLSVFLPDFANLLGIDIKTGKLIQLDSLTTSIKGYLHELSVEVSKKRFNLPVAFLDKPHTPFNIVGREVFFEQFVITFNERNKTVVLQ